MDEVFIVDDLPKRSDEKSNFPIQEGSGTCIFKCFICSESFDLAEQLENHVNHHIRKNLFTCSKCNKTFETASQLAIHNHIHSSGLLYECPKCNHGFTHKDDYDIHVEKHKNDVISYKCPVCQGDFEIGDLIVHMQSHGSENSSRSKNQIDVKDELDQDDDCLILTDEIENFDQRKIKSNKKLADAQVSNSFVGQ